MRIRAKIEYDGAGFCGWQRQPDVVTVQGVLESALSTVMTSNAKKFEVPVSGLPPIAVTGSGRTDSGVHACGQIAHFDWPESVPVDLFRLRAALDGLTPAGICVDSLDQVDSSFDARRSPHQKCYVYRLKLGYGQGGIMGHRSWAVGPKLDVVSMIRAARIFEGTHDFSAFRSKDCTASSTVRTVHYSAFERHGARELAYVVRGSGFLKQMVRVLVGTLVELGRGKRDQDSIARLLKGGGRDLAGITAPACGLTLEWVRYFELR